MSIETLKIISDFMVERNLPYNFMEWEGEILQTYFVGEYQETPTNTKEEDGYHETAFIINGFTRDSWLSLELAKKKIEISLPKMAINDDGSTVAIFYENAFLVPTGDAELKRMQINLTIKEWSVN